jgi:glucokinase
MTAPLTIGIDFGGTSIKLATVCGSELVGEIRRIPTQEFSCQEELLSEIVSVVGELRAESPGVTGVGMGVPGAVDFASGKTYHLTNVAGWSGLPLRQILTDRIGLPTVLENDANCMTFAEWRYGAAAGSQQAVCVTLGTGVGGGLILNGSLYRGSTFAAGEIGQMSIDHRGVPGPYGNSGALERYIGNRQISELAASLYAKHGEASPADPSPEGLTLLAQDGDPVALEVWGEVAGCLGACLINIVYLLNPETIVIGGGVAQAGDLLFAPLRRKLASGLTGECIDHLQILPARYGNTAGIIGSAALAAESGSAVA